MKKGDTPIYAPQRKAIIEKLQGDISYESIYQICKLKGYTNAKAEDMAKTILTYLDYSIYETADILNCNNRTIHRRINDFLKP